MSLIELYFFEDETLNKYNPLWLLGLVLIYFLIIYNTVYWYFFPNPILCLIFEEAAFTAWILQIMMILFSLRIIHEFIILRNEYHEERFKKIPIPVIIMFSVVIPILTFANNIFTANFLFSMILLIYGIIFTVLAYKFR